MFSLNVCTQSKRMPLNNSFTISPEKYWRAFDCTVLALLITLLEHETCLEVFYKL